MRTTRPLAGCLSLLLACGGGSGGSDGGGGDAVAADAATRGPVTVTVWARGAPAAAMNVMIHDPDGSFVRTVLTDAAGSVTVADFPAGGAVTVPTDAYGRPVIGYLTTITEVAIGDSLVIGRTPIGRPPDSAGTLSVGFGSSMGGAVQYQAMAGCNQGAVADAGESVLLSLRQVCVADGEVDVVAYAIDAADARIGHASATAVGIATGSAPLPAFQSDLGTWTVEATAPPAIMGVEGFYQGFRRGIPVDEATGAGGDISGSQSQAFAWKLAPAFFTEAAAGIHARYGDGTVDGAAIATVARRIADPPAGGADQLTTVDLGSDLFPEVSAVAVTDGAPLGVAFTAAGPLACAGLAADAAIWVIVGESPGDTGTVTTTWLVLSSGDLASGRQLPELDPALAGELWPAAAFTATDAGIIWIADSVAEHADFRRSETSFAIGRYAPEAAGDRCTLRSGRFGASARP